MRAGAESGKDKGVAQRVSLLAGVHKVSLGLQQQAIPQP